MEKIVKAIGSFILALIVISIPFFTGISWSKEYVNGWAVVRFFGSLLMIVYVIIFCDCIYKSTD